MAGKRHRPWSTLTTGQRVRRVVLWAVLVAAAGFVAVCVYAIWFVPHSPIDRPVSIGKSISIKASDGGGVQAQSVAPCATETEAYRAYLDSQKLSISDLEKVDGLPAGSPSIFMGHNTDGLLLLKCASFTHDASGGCLVSREYGTVFLDYSAVMSNPIGGSFRYTTTESVVESITTVCSCSLGESWQAEAPYYGISADPEIRNLTISGKVPTAVVELEKDGQTVWLWYYDGLDAAGLLESDTDFSFSGFTYREVIRTLDIRVGDENPYGK
ncbi:MAG: hypothetical protein WAY93_04830 [Atopobiaceae bacterium]|jgi:hypothetical protein|nr:hypothetical protein [Atopobiaceae bacterium]